MMPNKLFFKLLIGFWLICVLIAGAIVALPKIIELQRDPAQKLLVKHQLLAKQLANASNLDMAIKQVRRAIKNNQKPFSRKKNGRRIPFFVLTDHNLASDQSKIPRDINLAIIRYQENPRSNSLHFKRWSVFGPYNFKHQNTNYQLYVRDFHHKQHRHILATISENRWLLLMLVMLVSGVSCAFLAWHITKPINSLKTTARSLAKGDLSARAQEVALSHRDEIGQLAHSFNDMADSIEQMINNQQRLLSDISHELRTPLTRIQLALAINRRQPNDPASLDRIEQEAQLIDKMLQQLLQLSRINLSEYQQFESLNINDLLEDVIENAAFEAQQFNKNVSIDLTPDLLIQMQYESLASAIENVIRNAIRYASTNVTLSSKVADNNFYIIIEDDGPGVSEQHLDQLFQPFYRVSNSRNRSTGGTGLGLAIAKEAINNHKGKIQAKAAISGGLQVTIVIPINQPLF